MKLRIGSRGSQLALWQANHIAALLTGQGHEVEIEIIKTTGDRLQEITFAQVGSKGMFTKEIEEALQAGSVDLAVHSLKDLPTELPEPFVLAATPPRVDPRDVFVSVKYEKLAALPHGARVGTSSQRRRAQLKALRPDLEAVEFRGNVDTRLRKLDEAQFDAIILAAAGLKRLGLEDRIRAYIAPTLILPAAGQGALGLEIRSDLKALGQRLSALNHAPSALATAAERAVSRALGGSCSMPLAAYARWDEPLTVPALTAPPSTLSPPTLYLTARLGHPEHPGLIEAHIQSHPVHLEDAESMGQELGARLSALAGPTWLADLHAKA